jgi:prepilin-type processing-associated H-X9-DG protein/prepilin-type N-terminal cleavage/methylation domain-containing protein
VKNIQTDKKIRKFTLVELLVVIAIFAILAGLLQPALRRVQERAQKTYCASNAKQIGVAVSVYANDNDDYVPAGTDQQGKAWHTLLMPNASQNQSPLACPAFPADHRVATWKSDYGWNIYGSNLSNGMGGFLAVWPLGGIIRYSQIIMPGQFIMFGDARDRVSAAGRNIDQPTGILGQVSQVDPNNYVGVPSLHNGGSNMGFGDGHVEDQIFLYWTSLANRKLWSRDNK